MTGWKLWFCKYTSGYITYIFNGVVVDKIDIEDMYKAFKDRVIDEIGDLKNE